MEPAQVCFRLDGVVLGADMTPAFLGLSTQAHRPHVLLATPSPASSGAAPGSAAASSSEAASSSASAAAPEPAEDPGKSVGGAGEHEHLMGVAAPGSAAASSSEAASASASAAAPEMSAENPGTSAGGAGKYEGKYEHLMWVNHKKEYVQLSYPQKVDRIISVSFKNMHLDQAKLIGELLLGALEGGMSVEDAGKFKVQLVQQATGGGAPPG